MVFSLSIFLGFVRPFFLGLNLQRTEDIVGVRHHVRRQEGTWGRGKHVSSRSLAELFASSLPAGLEENVLGGMNLLGVAFFSLLEIGVVGLVNLIIP